MNLHFKTMIFLVLAAIFLVGQFMNCPYEKTWNLISFAEEEEKANASHEVLGRKLTTKEQNLYLNLTREDKVDAFKNDILPREQNLVVVRALIAVGESGNATEILNYLHFTETKTYSKILDDFTKLKEKYGSVRKGLEAENKFKLSEEDIFKDTALKAYKTVFGTDEEDLTSEEKTQLFNFLRSKEALAYTKMIEALVKSLTEQDKKSILFGLLSEIGRPDLKENQEFQKKILEQEFTHENLKKLLEPLKK